MHTFSQRCWLSPESKYRMQYMGFMVALKGKYKMQSLARLAISFAIETKLPDSADPEEISGNFQMGKLGNLEIGGFSQNSGFFLYN